MDSSNDIATRCDSKMNRSERMSLMMKKRWAEKREEMLAMAKKAGQAASVGLRRAWAERREKFIASSKIGGQARAEKLGESNKTRIWTAEARKRQGERASLLTKKQWTDPEFRKRMDEVHRGSKRSMETKRKISEALRARFNPDWRSVERSLKQIRGSMEYLQWREAVLERDLYTCQDCGAMGVKLHAHHLKPLAKHPQLACIMANGVTLCFPCHYKRHGEVEEVGTQQQ